jgi:hypothetical protein
VVVTLCDPHQFEKAESLNGELRLALFPGPYTITPADAGNAETAGTRSKSANFLII